MAKKDTYNYKGWLISDNFLKRAFAVFGYGLVPVLIIYGVIAVLAIIIGVLFAILP